MIPPAINALHIFKKANMYSPVWGAIAFSMAFLFRASQTQCAKKPMRRFVGHPVNQQYKQPFAAHRCASPLHVCIVNHPTPRQTGDGQRAVNLNDLAEKSFSQICPPVHPAGKITAPLLDLPLFAFQGIPFPGFFAVGNCIFHRGLNVPRSLDRL